MAQPKYTPHYTVADYQEWDGEWELWEGVAVAMSPSSSWKHQLVSGNIFSWLNDSLRDDSCRQCRAVYELDWVVADDTVVRPDISVVCCKPTGKFLAEAPTLIVEILSVSTREKDLVYKRRLYEDQGVRTYLVADPEARTWTRWTLRDGVYHDDETLEVELNEHRRVTLDPSRFFDS